MKKRRWVLVIAVLYTAAAVATFCIDAVSTARAVYDRAMAASTGSGGIGAVSAGIPAILLSVLPFLAAAVVVNRSIAAQAGQQGQAAIWIRRAHYALLVLTVFWPMLFFVLMPLSPLVVENFLILIAAIPTAIFAAHSAFGIFAIRLLRMQP
jgi:hypothetical protein